jgi:cobalt/nickel transport system permease protein
MISLEESFASGESPVHRQDPRIRILFAALLSLSIALADRFEVLFLALGIGIFLSALARLNPRTALRRLTAVFAFLVLLWLTLPFSFQGEAIASIGRFPVYRQGIEQAARISVKSVSILLIFMCLVTTMTVDTLAHVLYFFRFSRKLVFLLLITYRYLFVIAEEYHRLRAAMRIRCFKSGTNIHSFRSIAYMLGMIFVRSSLRAERVSQAMHLRGFRGRFYSLEDFHGYRRNPGLSLFMTLSFSLIISLEWIIKL